MRCERPLKLQILSVKHRDILGEVDKMLDDHAPLRIVQEMIERVYHEQISCLAIGKYKNQQWKVQKEKISNQKVNIKAIAEVVGKDGLGAGVTAFLWQALQTMTIPQLLGLKKALNDDDKVVLMKKQFALHAAEHRQKMNERGEAAKAVNGNSEGIEDYDAAQRTVQQVKEIFGIGLTDLEPRRRPQPLPAEKPPSAA